MSQLPIDILKKHWNYNNFISSQEQIIAKILETKDVLSILPTGAGKSLCYQIPALIKPSTCLVISPLIALMKNQVLDLQQRGIRARLITSETSLDQTQDIFQEIGNAQVKLLYVSPERLLNQNFQQQLRNISLSFVAIDEAHCIAEWGHDFRPSYLRISQLKNIFPNIQFVAFTATATKQTEKEIVEKLELNEPIVFRDSIIRNNLTYNIVQTQSIKSDIALALLKSKESSIVFTRSRNSTYELSEFLKRENIDVDFFHARLSSKEKEKKQSDWMGSNTQTMVSTTAFGMGIDKSNVRKVLHYHIPNSIESYVQEVGRAGRDGKPAKGILYYNHASLKMADEIFHSKLPDKVEFIKIIKLLYDYFFIIEGELPKDSFTFSLFDFYDRTKIAKKKIKHILSFLNAKEVISLRENQKRSRVKLLISTKSIQYLTTEQQDVLDYLIRNYAGITSEFVGIQEFLIARALNTSSKKVVELLNELETQKIISYKNRTKTQIQFLIPRENRRIKTVLWKQFETIQKRNYQKLQDIKFFVQQTKHCRQVLIQRYFGEKNTENCGRCDICKPKKLKLSQNFRDELIDFLRNEPKNAFQIQKQFIQIPKQQIIQEVQFLIEERKIKNIGIDLFQTVN